MSFRERMDKGTLYVTLLYQVVAKAMLPVVDFSNDLRGFLIAQNRTDRADGCRRIFPTRYRSQFRCYTSFLDNLPCKFIPRRRTGIHHMADAIPRVLPQ